MRQFDVVVAGGGHAGIEASMAAARMGCRVALVTIDIKAIGRMSCNPAIGGTAKGHLVYEIDALGGVMAQMADRTGIQFRILNKSKGPAVWSSRCQSDMDLYSEEALRVLGAQPGLTLLEGAVEKIVAEEGKVQGVFLSTQEQIVCQTVVLACGTFLNGILFAGVNTSIGGRYGEPSAKGLTQSLDELGIESARLKTGTPPRLYKDSIDFSELNMQPGDPQPQPFSMLTDPGKFPFLPQIECAITYTNLKTHEALRKGFQDSPLFTGKIKGIGPRYCPSVEDKIVRFAGRDRHQLFLEPQGLQSELIYLNGFASSLPIEVQEEAIHTVKGLEKARIVRFGYAVEYDFFPPHQVDYTLESRKIEGLYFAGQINGTSGYEEAAAQGLIAGITAALKVTGRKEFILKRDEAYIGVLLDALINNGVKEPYRMFTSRAEHRLVLRQDNADRRLLKYGYELGLVRKDRYEDLLEREKMIQRGQESLRKMRAQEVKMNPYLEQMGTSPLHGSESISDLCKRPQVALKALLERVDPERFPEAREFLTCEKVLQQLEIEIKYDGYIRREQELIARFRKLEEYGIPLTLDYTRIKGLSAEAKEKLIRIGPRTLGQASRIPGIAPADVSVLMIYLKG